MRVSDAERITGEYVERMEAVEIDVDGTDIHIRCADDRQAHDIANSLALLLADRIAGWRRVLDGIPSSDRRIQENVASWAALREAKS